MCEFLQFITISKQIASAHTHRIPLAQLGFVTVVSQLHFILFYIICRVYVYNGRHKVFYFKGYNNGS